MWVLKFHDNSTNANQYTFIRFCTFIPNTRVVVGAISIAFASPHSKTIESGFEELNASVSEVFVNRTQSL